MAEPDALRGRPGPADLAAAEEWFTDNGLPYFVDATRRHVSSRLARPRLAVAAALAVLVAVGVGVVAGRGAGRVSIGLSTATQVLVLLALLHAATALRGGAIAAWAARRTLTSLRLLVPLVTRALPLLLLFVTFFFINTEVWMVADSLDAGTMGLAILLFAAVATVFLLVRLPEEVGGIDDRLDQARVRAACEGTPLEPWTALDEGPGIDEPMVRLERVNLVLVLLVSQVVQVLLLSLSMFAFFLLFGAVTMGDAVVEAWIGSPPTGVLGQGVVSLELVKVATFLAAFSGLYFTVYAVSDESYRKQFFTEILDELERAVGAREVYRAMHRTP